MMTVTVMKRDGTTSVSFQGSIRVNKNFNGDKWVIVKDLTEEEKELYGTDRDCTISTFPTNEFYLILN